MDSMDSVDSMDSIDSVVGSRFDKALLVGSRFVLALRWATFAGGDAGKIPQRRYNSFRIIHCIRFRWFLLPPSPIDS